MFDIGAPEFVLLIVIAIVLFGPEKLPEFARKAAHIVTYVRSMAGNAQQQLTKELGPGFENIDVRDLNPRAFIQKHILTDVPIVANVKNEIAGIAAGAKEFASEVQGAVRSDGTAAKTITSDEVGVSRILTPFDPDAT